MLMLNYLISANCKHAPVDRWQLSQSLNSENNLGEGGPDKSALMTFYMTQHRLQKTFGKKPPLYFAVSWCPPGERGYCKICQAVSGNSPQKSPSLSRKTLLRRIFITFLTLLA